MPSLAVVRETAPAPVPLPGAPPPPTLGRRPLPLPSALDKRSSAHSATSPCRDEHAVPPSVAVTIPDRGVDDDRGAPANVKHTGDSVKGAPGGRSLASTITRPRSRPRSGFAPCEPSTTPRP